MGDVVNLRTVRKQKLRDDKARAADENRAKFGRSKAEKQLQKAEETRAKAALDGHKITPE